MIEVSRGTDLERKVWKFSFQWSSGYSSNGPRPISVRLVYYGEETRPSRRHKWRGEFWDSDDERRYHSKIERPKEVPADVLEEVVRAIRETPVEVFAGFFRTERLLHTVTPGRSKPCAP